MDCCGLAHGHALAHGPWLWGAALAPLGAMLAGEVGPPGSTDAAKTAEAASAALAVLRRSISVDVHSHGGKTGITSKAPPNDDLANAMQAGSLAVACLADVPDGPILARNAEGALAAVRMPEPGQLYKHHLERLAWMDEMVANHGLRRALSAADLEAAHKAGQPAIVADVEGLDFLDGKLERLEEAHQRGIRHLQLVHYTPNDIGDFQTGAITHHGLTAFGGEVIRACHRLGFVCDIAHATADMAKQAVKIATKPLLLSHTAVSGSRAMGPTPLEARQVTPDHARAIAETGGSIGIWHFFASLDKYVDGLKEIVEIVGVDHVSIGTDQHVTPGSLPDYTRWVHLVAAMLRGGFTQAEAGKIAGGNYMRIFRATVG
jgi:membrane dipeptidase